MDSESGQCCLKAVVMAGGEGSRLRPLTVNVPKPLVPVGNEPIMAHIVRLLARHGVRDVVTTLHYRADDIQSYFRDGSEFGVTMHHSVEDIPLGTAGSVKQAEELLNDGTFILISGDALTDCDLTAAVAEHKGRGAVATVVLARVRDPLEFGIVITGDDGRIERFLEKPGWGEVFSDTVNTGIYILEPEIFDLIEPRKKTDWSRDVFPKLLEANAPLYGHIMEGYWGDVGTLAQYREANIDMVAGKVGLPLAGEERHEKVWIGENTQIDDSATIIAPVSIGANCRIKRGATVGPNTVIGSNTLVEEGAQVSDSVVWDTCYLGTDTQVKGAILGSRVTLKLDAKINDGAVIGDRTLIDVGSTVRPDVKVWPDKRVDRGTTVTMSLVVGNQWRGNLFRELGVAGLSNIEVTPEFATRLGLAYGSLLPEGSRVLVARDSSRSSRTVKRSVIGALLSAGLQVVDLHGKPTPVVRHSLSHIEAVGAVNVRKLPNNNRLTVLEFYDRLGHYLPREEERKIEALFSREDFRRTDPEALSLIQDSVQPVEAYNRDFLKALPVVSSDQRPRVVIDYGFSAVSPIFPGILGQSAIEAISINSFNDARSAPRRGDEVANHLAGLSQIVPSVSAELGALVTQDGETLSVVDDQGLRLTGTSLFAALCLLWVRTKPGARIAMETTAPSRLEQALRAEGAHIVRSRAGVRDLMRTAVDAEADFAGNESGGFVFPHLHPGFDAMFALVSLVRMLQAQQTTLSRLVADLPEFHQAYSSVAVPWESKGKVMRHVVEDRQNGRQVEMVDGVKFYDDDSWILVLPDSFEPVVHITAESASVPESQAMVSEMKEKIRRYAE